MGGFIFIYNNETMPYSCKEKSLPKSFTQIKKPREGFYKERKPRQRTMSNLVLDNQKTSTNMNNIIKPSISILLLKLELEGFIFIYSNETMPYLCKEKAMPKSFMLTASHAKGFTKRENLVEE
jgi:hypothetical protein